VVWKQAEAGWGRTAVRPADEVQLRDATFDALDCDVHHPRDPQWPGCLRNQNDVDTRAVKG
jgi:hypothetical protein